MNELDKFIHSEAARITLSAVLFIVVLIVVYYLYKFALKKMRKFTAHTKNIIDDFMVELLRIPVLWLLFWLTFTIFSTYSFLSKTSFYNTLKDINTVLLVGTIGWILIKVVQAVFFYVEHKINNDPLNANRVRGELTKMKIFERMIVVMIGVITVAAALMTFDQVRTIGVSLLTSAGVAGIIVGLAAQKSIGAILAGIQIAITQPIRLGDQVVLQGENGTVEQINITYVIIKTWDGRRLIVPVSFFLEQTFQNWSLPTDQMLGTVYLYVDYAIPLEALRNEYNRVIQSIQKWDKKVSNLQVTNMQNDNIELRLLFSVSDAGSIWDVQVEVRERMVDFVTKNYPQSFVRTRIEGEIKNEVIALGNKETVTDTKDSATGKEPGGNN